MLKKYQPVAITAAVFFLFLISAGWAARPLVTDDALVTAPGKIEFESSLNYFKLRDETNHLYMYSTAKYGLWPQLEISGNLIFCFWVREGAGETGLADLDGKIKYIFKSTEDDWPILGVSFIYKSATGEAAKGLGSGTHEGTLNLLATQKILNFLAHANLGYNFIFSGNDTPSWKYGLAAEFPFNQKTKGSLEIFGNFPVNGQKGPLALQAGISIKLSENVLVDNAIAFGLNDAAAKYQIISGWTYWF